VADPAVGGSFWGDKHQPTTAPRMTRHNRDEKRKQFITE